MAHSHAHAHGDDDAGGTFFLDQLFTILVCGALGLVAILMYQTGMLSRILVPMFFVPVLVGGVAIMVLVAVRAIAVWQLAGARRQAEADGANNNANHGHSHSHGHEHSHAHSHAHTEDCGHEHGDDCGHDHAHSHAGDDHGHDHGWAPWRYMVLAIPVFLFLLGLPRGGLSPPPTAGGALQQSPKRQALSALVGGPALTKVLRKPEGEQRTLQLRFKELVEAAAIPARQEPYEGDIGIIRGQYLPIRSSDREFGLFRMDMTCCAADAVFLETRIIAPEPVQGINYGQWVQVQGVISFERNEKGKWIPVITLKSADDIDRNADATTDLKGV
jgi:DUF1980 C-terminal domain